MRRIRKWLRKKKRDLTRVLKIIKKAVKRVWSDIKAATYSLYVKMLRSSTSIVPNRIVIATNTFNYTCNPKYIYEELMRRNKDLDIYWIVKNVNEAKPFYPEGAKLLKLRSTDCIKKVYSAKVWINNGIVFSNYYDKKEGQIYLQTMHGSLGIKSLDNAVLCRNNRGKKGQRVVQREENNTDIVFTNSKFEEDVFKRVFWHDTKMERLGHARTDVLFEKDSSQFTKDIRQKLCDEYNIPITDKLVMYAPTHRKNLSAEDLDINYPWLCEELSKKFGGEYTVILRLHDRSFKLLNKINKTMDMEAGIVESTIKEYIDGEIVERTASCKIRDLSRYPDMQELMMVADVGITDYSSWIYDYVNTRRPGFIYATDIDSYTYATGFAYPLSETPFPVCEDNEELIDAIRSMDIDEYKKGVEAFLDEKEAVDDGNSAKRIVDRIFELMSIE